MSKTPRLLITGFGPFPGAPVNPTERLVAHLTDAPPDGFAAFRAAVLDVDYATIADQLSRLGREFSPDIAIHFGLAAECSGFRLERLARNSHAGARPDNSGAMPVTTSICAGPETIASRLPLERIAAALEAADLPVEWSDNAGGCLCNTTMTLSLAHACDGLAPAMSGFIHVPLVSADGPMTFDNLVTGTRLIIQSCLAEAGDVAFQYPPSKA